MASVNYKVPPVFTAQKPYSRWIDEIKAWKALTDLDKRKMGVAIALSLPEEGLSSIRDKVFSDLILDELNSDDGVDSLIEFMDKIFKMDELSEAYEFYTEFDRFRRSKVGSMEDGLRNGQKRSQFRVQSQELNVKYKQMFTSDITLLLSKDSTKKAKIKLDLENDSAFIFGKDVDLSCTSSGHYCVPIDQVKVNVNVIASTQMTKDKTKVIEKLHKQFARPSAKRLKTLLKDAGGYTEEHLNCVDHVTEGCDVCKRYKKTPARPVVLLSLATEYNEVVAIDLIRDNKSLCQIFTQLNSYQRND
ncbi:hypothetical protein GQR58_027299 [Nymphon striatum]|nr:hypothetical protein GQR58_027299 [Nymphon striatum]